MIRYTTYKNEKIRYSDRGKGRVVVLLHGFLESLEIWDEVADRLSRQYRVISPDLPGHGESSCIGYIHTMEEMAACVRSLLTSLHLRKYVLIGHSMGGYVALAYAEMFPGSIRGICLFHSTALEDTAEKKKDRQRAMEAARGNHIDFVRNLVRNLFAEENLLTQSPNLEKSRAIAAQVSSRGIVAALEGMKQRPGREHVLRSANYPVLFIIGKKDPVIPWESLLAQSKLPVKSRVQVLENAAHMGFYEAYTDCMKALLKFIRWSFESLK